MHAKKIHGECRLQRENLAETDKPTSKMPTSNQYLLVASQP